MTSPPLRPETIEKLASAVYPAFAMVAGMQLDVFTPLKDGPMSVEHLAAALAVPPAQTPPAALCSRGGRLIDGPGRALREYPGSGPFPGPRATGLPGGHLRRPLAAVASHTAHCGDDSHGRPTSQGGLRGDAARPIMYYPQSG